MPGALTEITEIATALGMVVDDLGGGLSSPPTELTNVPPNSWLRLMAAWDAGDHRDSFTSAFENGRAFLAAADGLRHRPPLIVEWKGPHRPPGDDVIPADLRIDHVYVVSCKYLSSVLLNAGPQRLFDRLLVGEQRSSSNWFQVCAPSQFQNFYEVALSSLALTRFPAGVGELSRSQQLALKALLSSRVLPAPLVEPWAELCAAVSLESARRWRSAIVSTSQALRLLWRMLRISDATYFVLGTDRAAQLRLRVDSTWDWIQAYELRALQIGARQAGQPEVEWLAQVVERSTGSDRQIRGHVEVRWSHGRFVGSPEAKLYLDTPLVNVPGYHPLV